VAVPVLVKHLVFMAASMLLAVCSSHNMPTRAMQNKTQSKTHVGIAAS
jgi:hypothetical protein